MQTVQWLVHVRIACVSLHQLILGSINKQSWDWISLVFFKLKKTSKFLWIIFLPWWRSLCLFWGWHFLVFDSFFCPRFDFSFCCINQDDRRTEHFMFLSIYIKCFSHSNSYFPQTELKAQQPTHTHTYIPQVIEFVKSTRRYP